MRSAAGSNTTTGLRCARLSAPPRPRTIAGRRSYLESSTVRPLRCGDPHDFADLETVGTTHRFAWVGRRDVTAAAGCDDTGPRPRGRAGAPLPDLLRPQRDGDGVLAPEDRGRRL